MAPIRRRMMLERMRACVCCIRAQQVSVITRAVRLFVSHGVRVEVEANFLWYVYRGGVDRVGGII